MILRIGTEQTLSVHEADDFKNFAVEIAGDGDVREVVVEGMGFVENDHVWVSIDTVLAAADRANDKDWNGRFAKMLEGVARFGWLSEDGTRIKSHIIRV